jgi:serine/threonine-protein phosphatase 2A regulatory subunit B''
LSDGPSFAEFWRTTLLGRDPNDRFLRLMTGGLRSFIFPVDLIAYVQAIVNSRESLQFLKNEALFQEKFVDFVVTRCFYVMDVELRGIAALHQFRRVDLAAMFFNAERIVDVNEVHHIFNYQHFYVAFCKFWDLDADGDGLVCQDDLLKFNESAISPIVINRFFKSISFPRSPRKPAIDFRAFSYFLISSEDKTTLTAIHFWFKLCDLDDDGVLSLQDIDELYDVQLERMVITGNETIPFGDIVRQLLDMVKPEDPAAIKVTDLARSGMADVFFNTLFDLQKFLVREYQFPLVNANFGDVTKNLSPWELYVLIEYEQLITDEE